MYVNHAYAVRSIVRSFLLDSEGVACHFLFAGRFEGKGLSASADALHRGARTCREIHSVEKPVANGLCRPFISVTAEYLMARC